MVKIAVKHMNMQAPYTLVRLTNKKSRNVNNSEQRESSYKLRTKYK
jgi:hypothetical protein